VYTVAVFEVVESSFVTTNLAELADAGRLEFN
jgi:hypothetical protein